MADTTILIGNYSFDGNGVIIPDTAEVQETVQNEFREALGQDLSLEESTPQGRLIDMETTARQNTIRFNSVIANVLINITQSGGAALDAWGANFGLYRNGATASTVPVTVTGVVDTVIPAGSQASTDDGVIWLAGSEIVIDDANTATGVFYCQNTGAVALGVNELTNIVASSTTGINGWETITNTATATLGSDIESDYSFRNRIINSIFSGTALFGNYASACYKVDGVTDVLAKDNPEGTALQYDNITIPAHSVYVCVQGGNSEDIAEALYQVKSAGAGWCGNTSVTISDDTFATKNTVTFQVPDSVEIYMDVYVTNLSNSSDDLETVIQNAILSYAAGEYENYKKLGIRALISPFTIAGMLNTQISGINVTKVEVGMTTPAPHAVASISKASVTSGLTWASVDSETFAAKVSGNGTYIFNYDGTNWVLDTTTVTLSDYGISIVTDTGGAISGDVITVTYADGELSQSTLPLFCSEVPLIEADKILVNING